jgi:hypothetical protein
LTISLSLSPQSIVALLGTMSASRESITGAVAAAVTARRWLCVVTVTGFVFQGRAAFLGRTEVRTGVTGARGSVRDGVLELTHARGYEVDDCLADTMRRYHRLHVLVDDIVAVHPMPDPRPVLSVDAELALTDDEFLRRVGLSVPTDEKQWLPFCANLVRLRFHYPRRAVPLARQCLAAITFSERALRQLNRTVHLRNLRPFVDPANRTWRGASYDHLDFAPFRLPTSASATATAAIDV